MFDVPTISTFYGITIRMYWDDHPPAHFHAVYGDRQVTIAIATLAVLRGDLPGRALALTLEWAAAHRDELAVNWDLCAQNQKPRRIPPLR